MEALSVGPVTVAVDGSSEAFQSYVGGVFDEGSCGKAAVNLPMLAVGYGTEDGSGTPFWRLKSSWGASWGEAGFMRIVRGKNMCGIATDALYPRLGHPIVEP